MVDFARLFDASLVATADEIALRLHDPPRLAPLPIVRPGVARHAGHALIALELRATTSLTLSAPCDGLVRRVALDPATPLPGGATEMLELIPLPFATVAVACTGLPSFYVAPFAAAPPDGERVARGAPLATGAARAWIAARFQDAFTPAPFDWIRAIAALLPAADQAAWLAQDGVYGARERLRVTDHVGAKLAGASFTITLRRDSDHGIEGEWLRVLDARADLALSVAGAPLAGPAGTFASLYAPPTGRHFALRWTAAPGPRPIATAVLSLYPSGVSAPPDEPLALAPGEPRRRTLHALAIADWFAPSPAGSPVPMFRVGSRVEPLVDGIATFARLAADLDDARRGKDNGEALGAHFTGLFMMDFPLVTGHDDTKLSAYATDILEAEGSLLVLACKILNLRDPDLSTLRLIACLLLVALTDVAIFVKLWDQLATDDHSTAILFLALWATGVALATVSIPEDIAEQSQDTLDTLNTGRAAPIAIYSRPPMTIDDNPLTPASKLYGLESDINQFGFWHGKAQMVKRAASGQPESHVAYLGGIDVNPNRVDTPSHQRGSPYHDVHARVTGPIVADVFESFRERWAHDAALNGATPAPLVLATPEAASLTASSSKHIARIGRTYYGARPGTTSPLASFSPDGERTIYETMLRAIQAAQDHIYIEDQYFTPNDEYIDALVAAAARCRRLVILIPTESDQIFGDRRRRMIVDRLRGDTAAPAWGDRFFIGSPMRRPVLARAGRIASTGRLSLARAASPGDDALFVTPPARLPELPAWLWVEGELMLARTAENTTLDGVKAKRVTVIREGAGSFVIGSRARGHELGAAVTFAQPKGIYVHAKCMMIDDVFVSIGSANTNRRGFFHDGELNVFAIPEALRSAPDNPARALRSALWAEQLGLPPVMASLLGDTTSAFDLFLRSRFVTRAAPLAAIDIRPQVGATDFDLIPGSILQVLKAQAGMIGLFTIEQLLDDIWNMGIDPTSFTDPNPQSGPL